MLKGEKRGERDGRGGRKERKAVPMRASIYLPGILRRVRMPSPLPLVDTHPLGSPRLLFFFFFSGAHHPRQLHRNNLPRGARRAGYFSRPHHVARGHMGRLAVRRRCRTRRSGEHARWQELHPLAEVNDLRRGK